MIDSISIEKLLAPCSIEKFFRSYVGQQCLHTRGERGRLSRLCSLREIGAMLSSGAALPSCPQLEDLLDSRMQGGVAAWASGRARQLSLTKLTAHVQAPRSCLVIEAVHEHSPTIMAQARHIENVLRRRVRTNAVVTFQPKTTPLHADALDHMVFNLQGCKRWEVFHPPTPSPLSGPETRDYRERLLTADKEINEGLEPSNGYYADEVRKIRSRPAWSGVLEPGDVLYVPRGWPHVVSTDSPPNLHIGFAIEPLTGVDLAMWLIERKLRHDPFFRKDLPVLLGEEEQLSYVDTMRRKIAETLHDRVVQSYHTDYELRGLHQPTIDLEDMMRPPPSVNDPMTRVQWAVGDEVQLEVSPLLDELRVYALGRLWEYEGNAAGAKAIVDTLMDQHPHTIAELLSLDLDQPDVVCAFVASLVQGGLAVLDP